MAKFLLSLLGEMEEFNKPSAGTSTHAPEQTNLNYTNWKANTFVVVYLVAQATLQQPPHVSLFPSMEESAWWNVQIVGHAKDYLFRNE